MLVRRIRFCAGWGRFPLWEARSIGEEDNVDPGTLPISDELKTYLDAWRTRFDSNLHEDYPPDSRFASTEEKRAFDEVGAELATRLQAELGPGVAVTYSPILG